MTFPSDPNCIFCKIITGDIPCYQLFEDDYVLSFLDVGPLANGHALVIPKGHWPLLDDVDSIAAHRCVSAVQSLGPIIRDLTDAAGWNLLQNNGKVAGQEVGHVHFHIIPRKEDDGLGYRWNAGSIDHDAAKSFAQEVSSRIQL